MITLAWATRTDVGLRRTANEDSLLAAPPVFAVADGMGGHAAGDIASAMAAEWLARLGGHAAVTRREVLESIRQADAHISRRACNDDTAGMGTTITGLAVTRSESGADGIVVFNVGDSRSYLLRNGVLTQISHDHSVVQELIDDGIITAEQAEIHPERNVITRSLGAGIRLDIDWWMLAPEKGDRFLLCSDGLFKEVGDSTLTEVLTESAELEDAASRLLDAALSAGASDNVSLVIVDVISVPQPQDPSMLAGDTKPRDLAGTDSDDDTNPNLRNARSDAVTAEAAAAAAGLTLATFPESRHDADIAGDEPDPYDLDDDPSVASATPSALVSAPDADVCSADGSEVTGS